MEYKLREIRKIKMQYERENKENQTMKSNKIKQNKKLNEMKKNQKIK